MAYNPLNPNGQASMAGSQPVVIASDQNPVSVTGTVNVGNTPGSVVAFQGTNPWIITGSVQGSFSASGNQSVSGTVGASVIGTVPVTMAGAWTTSVVGTVFVAGSVAVIGSSAPANQSVSGSVGIVGTPSISGTVSVGNFPTTQNVSGSVVAFQGTNPWIITGSVQGSFNSPTNQSVSGSVGIVGNVSVSGTVGASVIGTVPVTMAGTWVQSVSGTVGASIIGTVPVVQSGLHITSITGTPSISGTVNIGNNVSVSGTVGASVIGTIPITQSGPLVASVYGFYPEGSSVTASAPGNYNLGARNDTLASVLGGNGTYAPMTVGPVGEVITSNAPFTLWVSGNASNVGTASVAVIAAQGASVFSYITSLQIYNSGASSTLITLSSGGTILGYAAAPAGGGSNIYMPNGLKTLANAAFNMAPAVASSVVSISAQGFNSKV